MNVAHPPGRFTLTAALLLGLVSGSVSIAAPPANDPRMVVRKINESGKYILRMQKALAAAGYDPGTIDGIYGEATDRAVKKYLADQALAAKAKAKPAARPAPVPAPAAVVAEEPALAANEEQPSPQTGSEEPEPLVAAPPRVAAPAPAPVVAPPPAASTLVDSSQASRSDRVAGDTLAQVSAPSKVEEDAVGPPVMSPFSGPSSNRPMSPPASMAGLDLGDEPSGLENLEGRLLTEAVVTTSSKRAQRLQDVPMTVAWIPGEELEGTGQFTLCEAIQYFPGMECRRGAMRKVAVSARGLGSNFLSNRLLLLQDGRPQTDPWTGQFYADETTPLTNIKQVEVIRGPGSSLYGSNAFSGVINVIRRSPSDVIGEGRDFGVDARVMGGQYATFRGQGTAAGRAGPVEALVNYYGFNSRGADLLGDSNRGVQDTQEWSQVHQISGIVDVAKVVRLDVDFTDAALGRPGGNQISAVGSCGRCHYTPNDREHVQNLNANASADLRVNDNLRLFGQAYALFKARDVNLQDMVTQQIQTTVGKRNRFGGEARALVTLGETLSLTVGGDVKRDTVNNRNVLPNLADSHGLLQQTIIGGYADAEVRPLPNLVVGGGLRYDYYRLPPTLWTQPTSQFSPRASVVYHVIERLLTVRTNYGRAFRAPTLAELAINQQMYASTLIGNQDLVAETLDTVEAAVDYWPFDGKARFTVTGFYNLAKNFINQEHLGGSTSQFRNIGDAQVVGFEAEAAAQVKELNSSFNVAYQYLDARSLAHGTRAAGRLDYAPNHRLYFRGRTNIGSTAFVEFFAVYVSERLDPSTEGADHQRISLDGYLTANARVGANISKGVTVSLIGSNIFNSQHQESFGFPVPGASVFGEVKYTY